MYYEYFGLKQPPFRITPDTSLFYPGGNRGAVLEALIYAITNGEGIVKVVGEVGSGKTMLCRMLEKELPESVEVVYLANPSISPDQVPFAIALELKLPVQSNSSRLHVMNKLQDYLMREHARDRQVVVFVEEAQAMPLATLEEIRLLSNLETQQHKLLQIALFGQPELDEQLTRREMRQLKERITYSFYLEPFATGDIRDYLNARLRSCGFRAGEIFDRGAVRRIGGSSKGLVRRINILADKSLLAAYADGSRRVGSHHVKKAARDSDFAAPSRELWRPLLLTGLLLVIGAAGIWWWKATAHAPASPLNRQHTSAPAANQAPTGLAKHTAPAKPVSGPGPVTAELAQASQAPVTVPAAPPPGEAPQPVQESPATTAPETGQNAGNNTATPPASLDAAANAPAATSSQTAEDAGATSAAEPTATGSSQGPETGASAELLGLKAMYQIQDVGDSRLSPAQSEALRRDLIAHPPEVALTAGKVAPAEICRMCWSIVYRPVAAPENL